MIDGAPCVSIKFSSSEPQEYWFASWSQVMHLLSNRGWTEALTRLADHHVQGELFEVLRNRFTDVEITYLPTLVGLVNA